MDNITTQAPADQDELVRLRDQLEIADRLSARCSAQLHDIATALDVEPTILAVSAAITRLKETSRLDDQLLASYKRALAHIPACAAHGDECVPHAIDWIRRAKADAITYRQDLDGVQSALQAILTVRAFNGNPTCPLCMGETDHTPDCMVGHALSKDIDSHPYAALHERYTVLRGELERERVRADAVGAPESANGTPGD